MRAALLLTLLAACAPAPEAPPPPAPILSTMASKADFDLVRFAGRWEEAARLPDPLFDGCDRSRWTVGRPARGLATVRLDCLRDGAVRWRRDGLLRVAGPGRLALSLDGADAPRRLWALWADGGWRSAVLAVPDGRAAWILDRSAAMPTDRARAAREVLDFNGVDVTRLF